MNGGPIPGFFGKVSTQGDFVARRLPADFLAVWDGWLQQSLQKSREQLATAWLDIYLTSPVWRFALAPGVCSGESWAGVLMPSVDRVGRHFPLTVVAPVQGFILDCPGDAKDWYERVESLALRTLDKNYGLDAFEADLAVLPPIAVRAGAVKADAAPASNRQYCLSVPGLQQLAASTPAIVNQTAGSGLNVRSLWWSEGSSRVAPSLLVCEGLPAQASFGAMLDGNWVRCGWQVRSAVF